MFRSGLQIAILDGTPSAKACLFGMRRKSIIGLRDLTQSFPLLLLCAVSSLTQDEPLQPVLE
jgi:hypothetical protein